MGDPAMMSLPGARWLDRLKRFGIQALRIDPIRTRVARARFIYYVKLLKRLRTFDANSDGDHREHHLPQREGDGRT